MRVRRGHDLFGILAEDALPRFGIGEVTGSDGPNATAVGGGGSEIVEAKFAFSLAGVAAVAGETIVGENRPDVLVEGDLLVSRGGDGQYKSEDAANKAGGGDSHGDKRVGRRVRGFKAIPVTLSLNFGPDQFCRRKMGGERARDFS